MVQEATPLATAGTLRLLYLCWAAADPTCVQRLSRILSLDIVLLQCTVDHVPPADLLTMRGAANPLAVFSY